MKDLLRWDLNQLLEIAMAAGWLPKQLSIQPEMDCREARTPVYTDSIREARNLVHPGRLVRNRPGKEISQAELAILYGTCHAAYSRLSDSVFAQQRKRSLADIKSAPPPPTWLNLAVLPISETFPNPLKSLADQSTAISALLRSSSRPQ